MYRKRACCQTDATLCGCALLCDNRLEVSNHCAYGDEIELIFYGLWLLVILPRSISQSVISIQSVQSKFFFDSTLLNSLFLNFSQFLNFTISQFHLSTFHYFNKLQSSSFIIHTSLHSASQMYRPASINLFKISS